MSNAITFLQWELFSKPANYILVVLQSKKEKKNINAKAVISRGKRLEWKKIFLDPPPPKFKTDICYISRDWPLEVVSSLS